MDLSSREIVKENKGEADRSLGTVRFPFVCPCRKDLVNPLLLLRLTGWNAVRRLEGVVRWYAR